MGCPWERWFPVYVVVVAEGKTGPDRHRLLADVRVGGTNDLAACRQLEDALLEVADPYHAPQHLHQQLLVLGHLSSCIHAL